MFPNSINMNTKTFNKKPRQPFIKIEMSLADKIIEAITWALILGFWIYTIVIFGKFNESIPSHINEFGDATDYKQKFTLFLLPSISTIVVTVLSIFNQKPHLFNYPIEITEANAHNQYYLGVKLIRTLKLCITVEHILISLYSSQQTFGNINELGKFSILFTPFLMTLILGPMIYFMVQMYRYR